MRMIFYRKVEKKIYETINYFWEFFSPCVQFSLMYRKVCDFHINLKENNKVVCCVEKKVDGRVLFFICICVLLTHRETFWRETSVSLGMNTCGRKHARPIRVFRGSWDNLSAGIFNIGSSNFYIATRVYMA